MIACVIGNSAHAPSNTYAYAQLQQIGAVVGTIESGEWVLPRDQSGALARKPQLYAWIDAPVLMLTGLYNDFTFRFPTVMASFVTGVLVYLLGRRWYGRTGGLLAACLWASIHHMSKLTYVAVTDMLLTMFITASIFCADRLLFHRTARSRRTPWVIALWATMILGALSKGWGVVNLVLVGGTLGVATAVIPGFGVLGAVKGAGRKLSLAVRLVLRRWRRAARATRLGWGMLAMVGVLAPVWIAMRLKGGEEFHKIVYYEFYSRITGRGDVVPHSSSAPPILHLLYYMFPATVFAIGAMVLSGPRRWFSRTSPIAIPLIWIAAVVVPFSLAHGFRPDYLLPAYAAGALMGAWAIEEVHRRARQGGRTVSGLRHSFAAASIIICLSLIVVPAIYRTDSDRRTGTRRDDSGVAAVENSDACRHRDRRDAGGDVRGQAFHYAECGDGRRGANGAIRPNHQTDHRCRQVRRRAGKKTGDGALPGPLWGEHFPWIALTI